ncbi:L,D-transpeptidase [Consotaella salsifontis]|uniref:L,D-transpeptidase catalytic domain n=1 Tax=Consotaella salsifontis TaxID=1365950 RepID=A0A1T4SQP6_9HYPH|nr:L,D-transpeptidase [Consotaella salsifontis]SKA30555.1 L,D-transpeptidase catalytic domain [Consotaella salsifontis]
MRFGLLGFLVCILVAALAGPASAGITARIDISSQVMNVYEDGELTYTWPVSTARRGYHTPTGTYRAQRIHKMWYSRKYDMSPMPYSVFFKGGYAIHGTNALRSLGRPASHGCVRLHPANARIFYGLVRSSGMENTRIEITR